MKTLHVYQNTLFRKYVFISGLIIACILAGTSLMAQEKEIQDIRVQTMAVPNDNADGRWAIAIHGGAGGPARGTMSANQEKAYLEKLNEALSIGMKELESGGSSMAAVEAVVKFMEDCPLFNAGIGAVLNENGKAELDAAIMDGRTGKAGAVAGVMTIKNPIEAARFVMDKTNHVMLVGKGAENFAKSMGLKIVEPSYFITQERLDSWKKWKSNPPSGTKEEQEAQGKHGTVGAVALDVKGNLAAATSTGGMTGKMEGRVGDSPIIGAGTYANNNTCAVSATGHGEYFIRNVVAYDLSALLEYRQMTLEEAAKTTIIEKLEKLGATGGLIAVDREGNVVMPFNTNAMFRGFAKSTGELEVAVY
ncbi:MAG: isoaspartyl peptidase/L-asparaginase [Bacteroidales bacterium]|nr:isoaspartyl peptidase/L-asparaginase [Bacteroidales bacterium]